MQEGSNFNQVVQCLAHMGQRDLKRVKRVIKDEKHAKAKEIRQAKRALWTLCLAHVYGPSATHGLTVKDVYYTPGMEPVNRVTKNHFTMSIVDGEHYKARLSRWQTVKDSKTMIRFQINAAQYNGAYCVYEKDFDGKVMELVSKTDSDQVENLPWVKMIVQAPADLIDYCLKEKVVCY